MRNILWICTDQQRWDTLGCYGNEWVRTPNIDRLAEAGTLFENAFCQSPVCTPSRASLLTGRYPRTTRCRQNGQDIPDDERLVTRLLADGAGYVNGLAGKLHLSACHPSVCPATERRIGDGYHAFHWSHHPDPEWATNEYIAWLADRGVRFGRTPVEGSAHVRTGPDTEHTQAMWCAEKAARFLEANAALPPARRRPWSFTANLFDPHHPFDPPADLLARYLERLDEIPLPNYVPGELENKPAYQRTDHGGAYGGTAGFPYDAMTEREHRLVRAAYWAMCDLVDLAVGRMLDALEATGQRENTLVVFMSDHGELLGDHGMYLKGPHFYDCSVKVPLIVAGPGVRGAGVRVPDLVELTDLAPTLLEGAAGLPAHPGMQGRSLWPLLTGGGDANAAREDVYCEHYATPVGIGSNSAPLAANATMVRTTSHKLVLYHGAPEGTVRGELYDLTADPDETRNRFDDPEYAAVRLEMTTRLCDRMARTVDPLPARRAPW